MLWSIRSSLLLFLSAGPTGSLPAEDSEARSFTQADVYNALFEARRHCDEGLKQSRTEFIAEMFDRHGGQTVTLNTLKKLLSHRVEIDRQAVAELQEKRRELLYATEPFESETTPRKKAVSSIDAEILAKNHRIQVRECILKTLWREPD